ncbi:MAG: hypothetical protein AABX37_05365 [Nanoarchaeota archaeon]
MVLFVSDDDEPPPPVADEVLEEPPSLSSLDAYVAHKPESSQEGLYNIVVREEGEPLPFSEALYQPLGVSSTTYGSLQGLGFVSYASLPELEEVAEEASSSERSMSPNAGTPDIFEHQLRYWVDPDALVVDDVHPYTEADDDSDKVFKSMAAEMDEAVRRAEIAAVYQWTRGGYSRLN